MTHIAFSLPTETEEMANRPIVWGKTPAKEYSQIIQARASVLLANVRLQPIKERHHGFLSTLREAGSAMCLVIPETTVKPSRRLSGPTKCPTVWLGPAINHSPLRDYESTFFR